MKPTALRRFFLFLSISLVLSACSLAEDITPPPGSEQLPVVQTQAQVVSSPLYPLVPPNPADGASIFAEKCAPCHGSKGQGDGPQAAQLPGPVAAIGKADLARQATPEDWYNQVTKGNMDRFMPPFASLSDRQRWDVVAYAFSLSMPPAALDQGMQLYEANCAGCHGAQGKGNGPKAGSLPVQDLTDQAFMTKKSQADFFKTITDGGPNGMPAFGSQLSEDQRWALTAYVRALTFSSSTQPLASQETTTPSLTPGAQGSITSTLASPTAGITQTLGIITGTVTNASGGPVPSNLVLTLHGFDNMQMAITQTATIKPDNTFIFSNIQMPAGRSFIVTTDYNKTAYSSDVATAQAGTSSLNLPVQIFETTTDASAVKVDRLHLFFEFADAKTLRVIELYVLSNPSDKTIVPPGEGKTSINFILPQGATNLEFQDGALGQRFLKTSDGFGDTAAIQPGTGSHEVLFAFEMPYNRKLDLVQPLSMPVDAVVILIQEDGIKIKSDMLQDAGVRDVQGAKYHLYNGSALTGGTDIRMTISGSPSTGQPTLAAGSNTTIMIGLGFFGLALIVSGIWLFSRTRKRGMEEAPEAEAVSSVVDASSESPETLMDAIIALDDLYKDGRLPDEAYLKRREELKTRLKEAMDR